MKRIAYSPEFIEQALRKARERGKRTLAVVAVGRSGPVRGQ